MKDNNIDKEIQNVEDSKQDEIKEIDEEGKKFRIVQDRKEVKKALILDKESAFSRLKRRIKMFFYDLKFK